MKINLFYFLIILPIFLFSNAWSGENLAGTRATIDDEIDFLYNFLEGEYFLIGKSPDSSDIYSGKVTIKRSREGLEVIRYIKNKKIIGLGKIEYATSDKRKVLRVRFVTDDRSKWEATYVICSDLDNYARLTGYLYSKDGITKKPGVEALFAKAPQKL